MKKILLLVALVITASTVLSQTMVIRSITGVYTDILVSNIDRIDFAPCGIVEYEGQTYHTVKIGDQCWLAENLNIGTRINGSTNQANTGTIEKYCYNDDPANCTTYGGLYQWAELVQYLNGATNSTSPDPAFSGNVQGICPTGWHIPTLAEQQTLATTVSNEGNALKAVGQGTGDGAGTNTSGFSALLAGHRHNNGGFEQLGFYNTFLSSTEDNATLVYVMGLWGSAPGIGMYGTYKDYAYSIRCLKD